MHQYWGFIQGKFPSYNERRRYLAEQFEPLISLLEGTSGTPIDPTSDVLAMGDSLHVRTAWQRAIERRDTDPEGAITTARTLVETVCKRILDDAGVVSADDADLPKLYYLVSSTMILARSQQTSDAFKRIMGGTQSVVDGLAAMRNRLGDAHSKGSDGLVPPPALAGFVDGCSTFCSKPGAAASLSTSTVCVRVFWPGWLLTWLSHNRTAVPNLELPF